VFEFLKGSIPELPLTVTREQLCGQINYCYRYTLILLITYKHHLIHKIADVPLYRAATVFQNECQYRSLAFTTSTVVFD